MTERSTLDKHCPRFAMNFGIVKTVIIVVVFLAAIAIGGVDIALIPGAIYTPTVAPCAVSLAAAALIVIFATLILFNSRYKFKTERFEVTIGLFTDKISYDDVLYMRQNSMTQQLYLIIKNDKSTEGQLLVKINVSAASANGFIEAMREKIPSIMIELFTD